MNRTIPALTAVACLAWTAPAFAFCVFNPLSPYLCRSEQQWGGSEFNTGYQLRAGYQNKSQLIATLPPPPPGMIDFGASLAQALPSDYAWIGVEMSAHATMFGSRKSIVDGGLTGTHANRTASARASLAILGLTLYDTTVSDLAITKDYTRVFATVRAGVPLGPFMVSVSASASGTLGIYVGVGGGLGRIDVTPRPYVSADISATASVGSACAQVGVRGDLNAIEISLPSDLELVLANGNELTFTSHSDYLLTSLDGSISLFGDLCGFGDEVEIVSWDGYELSRRQLWHAAGRTTF